MKKTILMTAVMALTVMACKKVEDSKVVDTTDSAKLEVDSVKVDTLLLDVDTVKVKDTLK